MGKRSRVEEPVEAAVEGEEEAIVKKEKKHKKHKKVKLELEENVEDQQVPEKAEETEETVEEQTEEGEKSKEKKLLTRKKNMDKSMSKREVAMTWEQAVELMKTNPDAGLKKVKMDRHCPLPYHLMSGNLAKSFRFIADNQVGKYNKKLGGIVLAAGGVKQRNAPRVMDDQNVVHCDILIDFIILSPKEGQKMEARVTATSTKFVSALLFDTVAIDVAFDSQMEKKLGGVGIGVGDMVQVKHKNIAVIRGMCMLKAEFCKLVSKAPESVKVKVKTEAANTKTTFEDSEDDEGEE